MSETVIKRLPKYHRYLEELIEAGEDRISSQELSNLTGFTASQIRQDLNNFGGFGQQGYGYKVPSLKEEIDNILGIPTVYKCVLIGAGHLGAVISLYKGFAKSGFEIIGIFDKDDKKVGTDIGTNTIRHTRDLADFLDQHPEVQVGILTVPKEGAQEITDILVDKKIKGIWNFAPTDLVTPEEVTVESVRLNDSLLVLSYYLTERLEKEE